MKKITEQMTLRLPEDMLSQLKEEAARRGYTVNDLLIFLLHEHSQKATAQE